MSPYGLLRVRSRARVATGPKSIALLPLWFLKLSRTPKPLHFLLHVFIFSLLSLVIFLLGEGRDWPTFCVFLIQDWKNLCSLGTRPRIEGKRRKKSAQAKTCRTAEIRRWTYRISSNNSRGRLFLFSHKKGTTIRGKVIISNIAHCALNIFCLFSH